MTTLLLLACRRCGAALDPGPRAHLAGVLLDLACAECGKRALYEGPRDTAAGN